MCAFFQVGRKCRSLSIAFVMFVIETIFFLGRCFRCSFKILSGPGAFLLGDLFIISCISWGVAGVIGVLVSSPSFCWTSYFTFASQILFSLVNVFG